MRSASRRRMVRSSLLEWKNASEAVHGVGKAVDMQAARQQEENGDDEHSG